MGAARRLQRQIFVAGAVFGGRPQNGLGWLAGWAGWLAGWAYKGAGCSAPKDSLPFGRGPRAVGPQPNKTFKNKKRKTNVDPNLLENIYSCAPQGVRVVPMPPHLYPFKIKNELRARNN